MASPKEIWQTIGESFVQEYYRQFDTTTRTTLGDLYVRFFFSFHLMIAYFDDLQLVV